MVDLVVFSYWLDLGITLGIFSNLNDSGLVYSSSKG